MESWGLRPEALLGHSIGELTAAHVAGIWSLEDACTLVAARGRLMQTLPTSGTMTALQATENEIAPLLNERVSLAAINGPSSVVISGDKDAVDTIATTVTNWGRKTKKLHVSHAFHSPHMDPILDEFQTIAESLTYHPPQLTIISNLTGQPTTTDTLTPTYWTHHIRQPVRFNDGLTHLTTHTLLELGPDSTLTALTQQTHPHTTATPLLRKNHPEPHTTITALTHLHTTGTTPNWNTLLPTTHPTHDLPTYPFQHHHYWL
ncbi:acyltransferase domain-containing protein, partial [Streptomyces sp. DSM 41493]